MGLIFTKTFSAADINQAIVIGSTTSLSGFVFSPLIQRLTKRGPSGLSTLFYNTNYNNVQVETYIDHRNSQESMCGVFARGSSINTFYYLCFDPLANRVQLGRCVSGSSTAISNYIISTSSSMSHFEDIKIRLYVSGTENTVTLKGYLNDILIIDTTDTSASRIVATGRCGLLQYSQYDNQYFQYTKIYNTAGTLLESYDYTQKSPVLIIYNRTTPLPSVSFGTNGIRIATASVNASLYVQPFVLRDVDITSHQSVPDQTSYMSIIFSSIAMKDEYIFYWYNGTLYLYSRINGTLNLLASKLQSATTGNIYPLRVTNNAGIINCYFNDILHPEFTNISNSFIKEGWCGFYLLPSGEVVDFSISSIDTTPPDAPSFVVARYTPSTNILSWTNPSDPDLQKITLEGSTNGSDFEIIDSWDSLYGDILPFCYKDTSQKGKFYRIQAADAGNNISEYSTVVRAITYPGDVKYLGRPDIIKF